MSPREFGAAVAGAAAVLLLAACTPEPAETPTPAPSPTQPEPTPSVTTTAQPDPSVGQLEAVALTIADGTDPGDAEGHSLNVPAGWTAEIWANVSGARLAAWTPDGKLLVSTGGRGVVEILTPTEPGNAPTSENLLTDLDNPQGLAFALNDKILVVGERGRIVTYEYVNGTLGDRNVLVDNLPGDGHGSKGVAVQGTTVFYSLGSESNRDPADRHTDPERATVWAVDVNGGTPQIQATGVRNGFALAIAPDSTLFAAVNGMDNAPYPFDDDTGQYGQDIPEFINENPVEQVARLTRSVDLGWPYCLPDTRTAPDNLDIPFVNDPHNNPDGAELDCASIPNTMVGLPAHSAPLGMSFTTGTPLEAVLGSGALVTSHGSWNREPPREPNVAFLPWDDATQTLGAPVPLVTGFQSDAGGRFGRSVTAVPGPDGSLYVTDDAAGLVYRLTPPQ